MHRPLLSELSALFGVSERTARRYTMIFFQTGDVKPKKQRHGPPKLLGDYERLVLLQVILDNPGIYLHEIKEKLAMKFATALSASTICRSLKCMGCSRQVMCRMAKQRSHICRAHYMANISVYDPKMFLFLDESGCD